MEVRDGKISRGSGSKTEALEDSSDLARHWLLVDAGDPDHGAEHPALPGGAGSVKRLLGIALGVAVAAGGGAGGGAQPLCRDRLLEVREAHGRRCLKG